MNNRFILDLPAPYDEYTGEAERVPGDRYVHDPGRSIEVTPEMRARDEAERAAREAEREKFTWKRPAPLPEGAYKKRKSTPAKPVPTAKPQKPAPTPRPTQPATPKPRRYRMPSPAAFKVLPVVDDSTVPQQRFTSGRISPFVPLYEALANTPAGKWVPVEVAELKAGYTIGQSLRNMAKRQGKQIETRRNDAGTVFYFRMVEAKKKESK